MAISESNIICVNFHKNDIDICVKLAKDQLASRSKAGLREGGVSRIRNTKDRREKCTTDAVVGQIGAVAGSRHIFGSEFPHFVSRWYTNFYPGAGDPGSDVPGCNIDWKTSLIRSNLKPLQHHLLVRSAERHNLSVYVRILVGDLKRDNAKVYLMGWATDMMLPSSVVSEGPLKGAFALDCSDLHPLPPFQWNWFRNVDSKVE
jgi:hypothetical protein